eukprot:7468396-Heterocapsa_arctica.AAC.1
MAEFLGLSDPSHIRRCILTNVPHGLPQKLRARITTRRACAELIYTDTIPQDRTEWLDSMPTIFEELTDDYALAALM